MIEWNVLYDARETTSMLDHYIIINTAQYQFLCSLCNRKDVVHSTLYIHYLCILYSFTAHLATFLKRLLHNLQYVESRLNNTL